MAAVMEASAALLKSVFFSSFLLFFFCNHHWSQLTNHINIITIVMDMVVIVIT